MKAVITDPYQLQQLIGDCLEMAKDATGKSARFGAAKRFGLYWSPSESAMKLIPRKPRDWAGYWPPIDTGYVLLLELGKDDVMMGPSLRMWPKLISRVAHKLEKLGAFQGKFNRIGLVYGPGVK